MKKFLLLVFTGIVLFMPKSVEAKEYTINDFDANSAFNT